MLWLTYWYYKFDCYQIDGLLASIQQKSKPIVDEDSVEK